MIWFFDLHEIGEQKKVFPPPFETWISDLSQEGKSETEGKKYDSYKYWPEAIRYKHWVNLIDWQVAAYQQTVWKSVGWFVYQNTYTNAG